MALQGAHVMYQPTEQVVADIIFVHGLRGDAIKTWSHEKVCWPRDLLKEKINNARVITWGYDSSIAHLLEYSSQSSIFGHSENLLLDVANERSGAEEKSRPIIFVGHSLGGLVIKETLIRSSEYYNNKQNEKLGQIYISTKGVVFLGSPHRGSGKTSLGALIASIAKVAARQPNEKLLKSLETDSDILERQRSSFASISSSLPIVCLWEEVPTGAGVIVPQSSACIDGFNVSTGSIPKNHMDMCKYQDVNEVGFKRTAGFIVNLVDELGEASTASKCELWRKAELYILSNLKFPGINERHEEIAQAHKETFEWIYDKPELGFVEWLNKGCGIYWISGKAGCGKSTLMKFLFQNPRTRQNLKPASANLLIAGFFFHDRGNNPLLKSQVGLFCAILYQILSAHTELIPIIAPSRWNAQLAESICSGNLAEENLHPWSLLELKQAFRLLVAQDITRLHLLLIIDGLDEFSGEHEDIVNTLNQLLPKKEESAVQVQLCLSSRPLLVFERAYKAFPQLKVHDLTAGDIRKYVKSRFGENDTIRDLEKFDPNASARIIEDIVEKSSGVFLWVHLVVKSLVEGLRNSDTMEDLQRRLHRLPPGLEPLYERMIQDIDEFYREQASRMFQIVLTAALPLSPLGMSLAEQDPRIALVEKNDMMSGKEKKERRVYIENRLKSRCMGLVEIQEHEGPRQHRGIKVSRVQFLHLTVKEFLQKTKMQHWLTVQTSSSEFNPDVSIVGAALRLYRITGSLDLYDHESKINYTLDSHGVGTFYKACLEGIIFLIMTHARRAEKTTKMSQLSYLSSFERLISSRSDKKSAANRHWSLWRYVEWSEPSEWHSDFFSYLIAIGMNRAIFEIIRQGCDPRKRLGRPYLLYAVFPVAPDYAIGDLERDNIDPEVVEALLEKGCSPNEHFTSSYTGDIRDSGPRTVWEAALVYIRERFLTSYFHTEDANRYGASLGQQEMRGLIIRWLKTVHLFLEYGADATIIVVLESKRRWKTERHELSALSIFNQVFSDIDDPLVSTVRRLMIGKGAKDVNKYSHIDHGWKGGPTHYGLTDESAAGGVDSSKRSSKDTLAGKRAFFKKILRLPR